MTMSDKNLVTYLVFNVLQVHTHCLGDMESVGSYLRGLKEKRVPRGGFHRYCNDNLKYHKELKYKTANKFYFSGVV